MTLTPEEYERMQYLLGKANRVGLEPNEQEELRRLVQKENPAAKNEDFKSILAAAALIVGIIALISAFSKK